MSAMTELNAANPWEATLANIKSRVSINTFCTWFSPTRFGERAGRESMSFSTETFAAVLTRKRRRGPAKLQSSGVDCIHQRPGVAGKGLTPCFPKAVTRTPDADAM
jgi:hypothetical protein